MKTLLIALAILKLSSCREEEIVILPPPGTPPDMTIQQLLLAPDTILAAGGQLYLSTYMWRDFMPIAPPDGRPLIELIYVTGIDSSRLLTSVSADAVWIVYNNQVWKSWLRDDPSPPGQVNRICKRADGGPKWGPMVYTDVVVRITDGTRHSYLLHAPHQWIGRTD